MKILIGIIIGWLTVGMLLALSAPAYDIMNHWKVDRMIYLLENIDKNTK